MIKTDVNEFMGELGAGALIEKVAVALSEAGMSVCTHGSKSITSKVTLEMTFSKMGDHDQVIISHKISTSNPTARGRKTDMDTTETAMFVGPGGVLSIAPPKVNNEGQFELSPVDSNQAS